MRDLCEKIINDYKNQSFDKNEYYFYANRRDYKDLYRTGVITFEGQKYFFKIIDAKNRVDEDKINGIVNPTFKLAKKITEQSFGEKLLVLYEYLDTININCYNFLRSKTEFDKKEEMLNSFFENYINLEDKFSKQQLSNNNYLSDIFFIERCKNGARITDYYSSDLELLIEDIKGFNLDYEKFSKIRELINGQISNHYDTITTYCHGDFHDFNFSLNKIFWDVDTFGINPILNDFVIYYWHYYARENYLILKYNWWLFENMFDTLSDEEKRKVYNIKEENIKNWWKFIHNKFNEANLLENLRNEFLFRLFCRVFLVDNVLKMEEDDRKLIYSYFLEMLDCELDESGEFLFNTKSRFIKI